MNGEFLIHHKQGICILKEFSNESKQRIGVSTEHKSSMLNYKNNETETNRNLSIAHEEKFEKRLSGFISQNFVSEYKRELRIYYSRFYL